MTRRPTDPGLDRSGSTDDPPSFAGAVLVGGSSRRMGADKAFVEVDGRSLAQRALAGMRRAGADEVMSIGGEETSRARLRAMGYRAVADDAPGQGPLAGIVTALRAAGSSPVLIWAVDQPWTDGAALPALRQAWPDRHGDVLALAVEPQAPLGRPARRQLLAALYDRRCHSVLAAALRDGERSVERAVRDLVVDELRLVVDADVGDLWDLDSRDDLRRYAARTASWRLDDPGHAERPALGGAGRPSDRRPTDTPGGPFVSEAVPEIHVTALAEMGPDGVALVDVRQPHEYVAGHVPGARLVPLGEVPERVAEFPVDGPVYLICQAGGRSRRAAEFLRSQGIDAVNLAGGTGAWIEASHPVVTGDEPG